LNTLVQLRRPSIPSIRSIILCSDSLRARAITRRDAPIRFRTNAYDDGLLCVRSVIRRNAPLRVQPTIRLHASLRARPNTRLNVPLRRRAITSLRDPLRVRLIHVLHAPLRVRARHCTRDLYVQSESHRQLQEKTFIHQSIVPVRSVAPQPHLMTWTQSERHSHMRTAERNQG
jgi:hypothetical protein